MTVTDAPVTPWPAIFPASFPVAPADCAGNAAVQTAVLSASEILWWLSGRRYGTYSRTFRPCRRPPRGPLTYWPGVSLYSPSSYWPLIRDYPMSVMCGLHGDNGCSCTFIEEAVMPAPTQAIIAVKVDGVVLDPATAYRTDDSGQLLVRTDGGVWPWCQHMELADTAVGTWSVALTLGLPVPVTGQRACGELAAEFYKQDIGAACKLPVRIQSLSRQGVSMQFIDPQEFLKEGRTGLYLTDLFLGAVNPERMRMPSAVFSPDVPRGRWD